MQRLCLNAANGKSVGSKYEFMSLGDIPQLIAYYQKVENEQFGEAFNLQHDMDTDVYESIVSSVYNYVAKHG